MSDIINLNERRNAADKPDADFVRHDDFGRPMYLFLLEYAMPDGDYGTEVWAYNITDANERVEAMRESLIVLGQAYTSFPA